MAAELKWLCEWLTTFAARESDLLVHSLKMSLQLPTDSEHFAACTAHCSLSSVQSLMILHASLSHADVTAMSAVVLGRCGSDAAWQTRGWPIWDRHHPAVSKVKVRNDDGVLTKQHIVHTQTLVKISVKVPKQVLFHTHIICFHICSTTWKKPFNFIDLKTSISCEMYC